MIDLFFNPQVIEYSTDAGEPSGTAGKPILNTLKKNKIVNRVVFVERILHLSITILHRNKTQ